MLSQRDVAFSQGVYFLATGIWPLLHLESFESMTGPKADKWLVRTVGMLVGVTGAVLLRAAVRDRVTPEVSALGVASAASLGAVDTLYAIRGASPASILPIQPCTARSWPAGRRPSIRRRKSGLRHATSSPPKF